MSETNEEGTSTTTRGRGYARGTQPAGGVEGESAAPARGAAATPPTPDATDVAAIERARTAARAQPGFTEHDAYLFNEGTHFRLWEKLGAHQTEGGVRFGVWAPNAHRVSVIGDFNDWNPDATPLEVVGSSGVWQGVVEGVEKGARYKYHIRGPNGFSVAKADPFGVMHESPPATASIVWDLDYEWSDDEWMNRRERDGVNSMDKPMSTYEVHLGSWMRDPSEPERILSYREVADRLADHCERLGFTHVELLPIMEHPFHGSWGYQTTGYFAPSSRYGSPQDLMHLVDTLHQRGIGVIFDWVPSHFPSDEHGLVYFDGTHLFEHADPRRGFHPDWQSYIFNYGRHEVRAFLISSALYWVEKFHGDGLRVDAVASMLYLDYSRKQGEWIPNEHGGRENLEAIDFLKRLNTAVYERHPHVQTIAEESTAWPMVSRPTYVGGLGFGAKWDMGWMHDTLTYMQRDPIHRSYHHNQITFRMVYAFTESYVLPLSHDEVVHGKGSLLGKMPGDEWQRFANLRVLLGYMWTQPGKKLLFMGGEFGQQAEWNHDRSLDWHLLDEPSHRGIQQWVGDLNALYRSEPALHRYDVDPRGFEWVEANDSSNNVLSWLRRGEAGDPPVLIICNFTPVVHHNYRFGLPVGGTWREVLNSDAHAYGGSGQGNMGAVECTPVPYHGKPHSMVITVPPLSVLVMRPDSAPGNPDGAQQRK